MSQIGEIIALPGKHNEPNDKCPFCPPAEPIIYKTYPGSANDSTHLGNIMEDPSKLVQLQPSARPQKARVDKDGYVQEQSELKPRCAPQNTSYTHQAHHLISGKQGLKGTAMEDWILASQKNDKDTGYSINSTGNGFWAPSYPNDYPLGVWGKTTEKQEKAEAVMKAANAQIHISHHRINDKGDTSGVHQSYDSYIKKYLAALSTRMHAWSTRCYLCEPNSKKNHKPTIKSTMHWINYRRTWKKKSQGHIETGVFFFPNMHLIITIEKII